MKGVKKMDGRVDKGSLSLLRSLSLITETASFVDRLFRSLESESYLTGQDPKTPPSTPTPPSRPSTREGEDAQSTASSASLHSGGGGGGGGERRYSEDLRSREVRIYMYVHVYMYSTCTYTCIHVYM